MDGVGGEMGGVRGGHKQTVLVMVMVDNITSVTYVFLLMVTQNCHVP